jgi:2-keto-4-pentenoate hydratase/2-oxohepta-3-ene-1,7-dioic acid hydratase in catechol pathway
MRYVSYELANGTASYGLLAEGLVRDIGLVPGAPVDLRAALQSGRLALLATGVSTPASELKLLPVIPNPSKILCVGLNYESHRKETGRQERSHPAIFTRFADTLVASGQGLVKPRVSDSFDYEGELALVIGRPCHQVSVQDALSRIAGYSCFNDASVRDWQQHNIQFTPGKNFPATGALGPSLVTPDEVPDLRSIHVVTTLNGTVVQDQSIGEMIWGVAELIAYISAFTPLGPGDVIATGTPGGVGSKRTPPLWMKPGDSVSVAIGSIGTLTNPIVSE